VYNLFPKFPFLIDKNNARWWVKDIFLTDRSMYLFQEKGDILSDNFGTLMNYSSTITYIDRLDLSSFRATKIEALPSYSKQIPTLKAPYVHLIEL
jgi:hypothetical protein